MPASATTRQRLGFAVGSAAAGLVTVGFATIGDGVDASAQGSSGVLVEHGRTASGRC